MNLDWAKQWLEEGFKKGLDHVMEMYADDVEFEDVIFGERLRGKTDLRRFFSAFFDPHAGVQTFKVDAYRGSSEAGAVEWTWHGQHTGELLGVPAAGKTTQTRGVSVFTFKDGRITSQHDYWNAAAALRQLGAIP